MESFSPSLQVWRRKLERNLQDHGWQATATKVFAYLFHVVFRHNRYRLYRIDLQVTRTEVPRPIEGVEFSFISAADRDLIGQIEENSEWFKGSVAQRLVEGALCLVAIEDGRLAGFNLVSFGPVYMPLVRVSRTFRPDEAWSEQISIVRTFRKRGLASQLRYRIFDELRRRGIRTFYGGALASNHPSLALARRVGFEQFAEIRYTRAFSLTRVRYVRVTR